MGGDDRVLAVWHVFRLYGWTVLQVLGTVLVAVVGLADQWWLRGIYLVVGAVALIAGLVLQGLRIWQSQRLRTKAAAVDRIVDPTTGPVVRLLRDLMERVVTDSPDHRLSLWVGLANDDFALASRYSSNGAFKGAGRMRLTNDQSLVGKAWREGRSRLTLSGDRAEWELNMVADSGLQAEVVRSLRMKSLSYACVRVETQDNEHLGVLVLESLRPKGAQIKHQDQFLAHDFWPVLVRETAQLAELIRLDPPKAGRLAQ